MANRLKFLTNQYIALSLTIITSFWFWRMIQADFPVTLAVVLISFLLMIIISEKKFNIIFTVMLFILAFLLCIFLLKNYLDRSLWVLDPAGRVRFDNRHYYFARELGKLYTNKFSAYYYTNFSTFLYKYQTNLFLNLDPNLYFFASHPREKSGIDYFEKYSPLLLPFFVLGIIWLFSNKSWSMFVYLILVTIISGFILPNYKLGPVLFSPILNIFIALGIVGFFKNIFKRI